MPSSIRPLTTPAWPRPSRPTTGVPRSAASRTDTGVTERLARKIAPFLCQYLLVPVRLACVTQILGTAVALSRFGRMTACRVGPVYYSRSDFTDQRDEVVSPDREGVMTIAACYVLPEGVVFGCDSTWTVPMPVEGEDGEDRTDAHYFNHGQKLFEVGQSSTLGVLVWGLNSLPQESIRTTVAAFMDRPQTKNLPYVKDVAEAWAGYFWEQYVTVYTGERKHVLKLTERIKAKSAAQEDQTASGAEPAPDREPADDGADSEGDEKVSEEDELESYKEEFGGGFCIGGYIPPCRKPEAYEITYDLSMDRPAVKEVEYGRPRFWGWGNLIERLLFGIDLELMRLIAGSKYWKGSDKDLVDLVKTKALSQPAIVPIRDALDWVHASIYTTIKALKFSHLAPICGGPIELAVITSDRSFRWVRHKGLDSALLST